MEIYNDHAWLETDEKTTAPINIALSSITDIATGKIPFSKTIKIPDTPGNRRKLGYSSEVFSLTRFNNARHQARIEQEGFVVMQGVAQLSKVETTPTGRYFHMNMIGNEIEWITKASETLLSETDLGLPDAVITDSLPRESLSPEHTEPYRLFPVQRGKFIEAVGDDKWQDRSQTMLSDYAPFFHLPTLFRAIFRQAGYTVSSSFLESGAVADLYASGRWKRFDTDELDEKYGFKAGRFAGKEIKIGMDGVNAADIGNIVETANPDAENSDGEKAKYVYNHGDCFQMVNSYSRYNIPEDMTVGLLYSLNYCSPVLPGFGSTGIENCKWLNRIEIPQEGKEPIVYDATPLAPNFNTDVRKAITAETEYYFTLSPTYAASTQPGVLMLGFQPSKDENVNGDGMIEVWHKKTFVTGDTDYGRAYLFRKLSNTEFIGVPDQNWKLAEVPKEVEISARIYIPANRHLKGQTLPIPSPSFKADRCPEGIFSMSKDTTVETYFAPQVGAGDPVNTENMLAYDDVKQLDLIKAVKQLFNLYLYTDTTSRTVYVEPLEQFYTGPVLDWTDKTDYSKEIEMEEIGGDLGRNFVLSYKDGDPQVSALNESTKSKYAQYSTPILNTVGKQEDYTVTNEVFTPAIIKAGGYSAARDAALLQIGDPKDTDEESPYERDMSFEPKVVRYAGLRALPAGQQWLYPSGAESVVPAVSFQDEATNLGFDNEDGLNRYYRENAILYNHGRRLTLYLNLTARDVEPFVILNEEKRDFRATIRVRMDGEDVLCKLEEIKDFDPRGKGSTKCVLITG